MKINIAGLVMVVVAFAGSIPNSWAADNSDHALGQAQLSVYGSTLKSERGLFTTDFIVPLYYPQAKDTLFFFNPKYTYSTPETNEFHQGLGLRHIFHDSFILGLNTFFDRRQTSDAWSSQVGVGLEYLSRPLDLRANWYKPTTRHKVIGHLTGTYYFANTALMLTPQEEIEEPLQGLDFEVGVPVFDKYTRTRLYLGGYFYQSRLSKDVNGLRVRTETNLTQWLAMDTTFNSRVGSSNEFYGGLRVNLAFDMSNLFKKHRKPFFSAPPKPESNDTYLQEKLFDRVVRDIDIQTTTSTRVSGSDSLVESLIYVNSSNNTGIQQGTLQYPYLTIAQGITAASSGQWVYAEGNTSSTYSGGISLANSQVLWGSGYNGGFSGLAISGVYPIINGSTNGITLANNNTVMGVQIQNATNDGIKFTNGTTLTGTIQYNNISNNTHDGIDLSNNTGAMTSFTITNNTVNNNSNDGIDLSSNGSSGTGTMTGFTISNNTINSNSINGIDLRLNGGVLSGIGGTGTITNLTITGNTVSANHQQGITLAFNGSNGNGTFTNTTISNNTVNNNTFNGIISSLSGNNGGISTITNLTISNNTANSNGTDGIATFFNGNLGTGIYTNLSITHNTATANGADGISLYNNGVGSSGHSGNGTMTGVTITDNTVTANKGDGFNLSFNGGSINATGTMTNFTISNNTANDNNLDGIDLSHNGTSGTGTMTNFTISNNTLDGNGGVAINQTNNSGTMTGFTISNNS